MKIDPHGRRAFLQGVAGAMLSIPLLPSLLPKSAHAQATTVAPSRFVFMGATFGRDINAWYPTAAPMQQTPDGVLYSALSDISGPISYILNTPFDALRKKISILRGLDCMQPGDAHTPAVPLTASGAQPSGAGYGYSIDAVLEESKKFYKSLPMAPAIRTCPNSGWDQLSFSVTSGSAPKQSIWHEWDPSVVYNKYFDSTTVAKNARQATIKQSVIDRVLEDYRRALANPRLGKEDKRRLDNYLSLLVDAEARLGVPPVTCSRVTGLGERGTDDQRHTAAINLEVAALACGMTRIVCHNIMQVSSEPNGFDAHAEAHQQNKARSDPSVTQHAIHNRWVMEKVAEMLSKLDSVEEERGTVLDDTVFLYGNCEARGFHNQFDMPVLIAGGGGKLRTGYYLDYRPHPLKVYEPFNQVIAGRPYNNLLVTLFQALGHGPDDYQRFGLPGFGVYDQFASDLRDHYAPFLKGRNDTLPFLYV